MKKVLLSLIFLIIFFQKLSLASEQEIWADLKKELLKRYPQSEISISMSSFQRELFKNGIKVQLIEEDYKGNIHFNVFDADRNNLGDQWLSFSAWANVLISQKRIRPGELIFQEDFDVKKVNISDKSFKDNKSILYYVNMNKNDVILNNEGEPVKFFNYPLESNQTILEGSYLTTLAIRRTYNVKRGESVKVRLVSNNVILNTIGKIEEPAYWNQSVRVSTGKEKKQLSGILLEGSIVEINL